MARELIELQSILEEINQVDRTIIVTDSSHWNNCHHVKEMWNSKKEANIYLKIT